MNLLFFVSLAALANSPLLSQSVRITQVQAVYGAVQPARQSNDYFPPHDNLCYRFQVSGLRAKDGRLDAEVAMRLLNAKGKMVAFKNLPVQGFPVAGERPITLFAHVPLTDAPPGAYTAEVTVTDNVSGVSSKFERPVVLKAPELAIVGLQFSHDREGRLPAPARMQAGQQLFYRMLVAGFDESQRRVDVAQRHEIVQADSGAVVATFETAVKQAAAPTPNATMLFDGQPPVLLQAGHYVLRTTVTDRIADKTVRYEFGIEVTAP